MNGGGSELSSSNAPSGIANVVHLATAVATKQIERTPPHSEEAEMAVLGSLLIQPDAIGDALEKLGDIVSEQRGAEYFYDPRHQIVFETLADMYDRHLPIDPITLKQRLVDKGLLDAVGGENYLHELYGCVGTVSNLSYYLSIVRDHYLRRRLIEVGSQIVADSFDFRDETTDHLADRADRLIFEVTQRRIATEAVPAKILVQGAMEAVEDAHEKKGALTGVPSGFHDLDRLTSGFREGEMIVIAARPSKGKTALAMNIVEHVAIEKGLPVAVFSLEMTAQQLILRMLSSLARVDSSKMRDGFTSDRDHLALTDAATRLSKSPIYVDDAAAMNILHLRAKVRRLKKKHGIRFCVVDYMQLLHGSTRRIENRAQEVAEISGGIKALAKELKIPILVVSQLNREVEKRDDRKPRLADLRESGAIEQDADVVLLLARGSAEEDEEGEPGKADLVIAKQRNGPTGNVELTFLSQYTRFVERAKTDVDYASVRGME